MSLATLLIIFVGVFIARGRLLGSVVAHGAKLVRRRFHVSYDTEQVCEGVRNINWRSYYLIHIFFANMILMV
jgi:hypothetical protein